MYKAWLWLVLLLLSNSALGGDKTPTFHKEVSRILYQHCVVCHREGEVGPFPLVSYEDARKRADLISEVVQNRSMPP